MREIEIVIGERLQDMVGQFRSAGVGCAFLGSVAALRDIETRRALMQMLNVHDLGTAIDGDGRREVFVKEFALVVADDHDGFRAGLRELGAERLQGFAAARVAFTAGLDVHLICESGCALLEQGFVVIGAAAIPVALVFAIRLGADLLRVLAALGAIVIIRATLPIPTNGRRNLS